MIYALVGLYVLAAILPIGGFARLLWRYSRRLRKLDEQIEAGNRPAAATYTDIQLDDVREPVREEVCNVRWDIVLVGTGLTCGAFASIWAALAL